MFGRLTEANHRRKVPESTFSALNPSDERPLPRQSIVRNGSRAVDHRLVSFGRRMPIASTGCGQFETLDTSR
jgi:hypothetical protein